MRLNINIHRLIKHVSSIGILAGLLTCFVPVACIAQETNHFIQKEDTAIYGKKGDVMPEWKPGVKDDKPVRVLYTVPISWHL